jgi:hypothetical protein
MNHDWLDDPTIAPPFRIVSMGGFSKGTARTGRLSYLHGDTHIIWDSSLRAPSPEGVVRLLGRLARRYAAHGAPRASMTEQAAA